MPDTTAERSQARGVQHPSLLANPRCDISWRARDMVAFELFECLPGESLSFRRSGRCWRSSEIDIARAAPHGSQSWATSLLAATAHRRGSRGLLNLEKHLAHGLLADIESVVDFALLGARV